MIILYNDSAINMCALSLKRSATELQEQLNKLRSIDDTFVSITKGPISQTYKNRTEIINENLFKSIITLQGLSKKAIEANDVMKTLDEKNMFGFDYIT